MPKIKRNRVKKTVCLNADIVDKISSIQKKTGYSFSYILNGFLTKK